MHAIAQYANGDARVALNLLELSVAAAPIVDGDRLVAAIAAASILAKTTRDALLVELDFGDAEPIDDSSLRGHFERQSQRRFALGMLVLLGAGIAGFSLSKLLPLSYAMLLLVGASMMAVFATMTSLVQLSVTNEMRGRVMSVYNFAFRGGMPIGNLVSGWLVPAYTAPVVLGVNGLLLIVVALYFLLIQRRVAAL